MTPCFGRDAQPIQSSEIFHLHADRQVSEHRIRYGQPDGISGQWHCWGTQIQPPLTFNIFTAYSTCPSTNIGTTVCLWFPGWWDFCGPAGVWTGHHGGFLFWISDVWWYPGPCLPVPCFWQRGASLWQHGSAGPGVSKSLLYVPDRVISMVVSV